MRSLNPNEHECTNSDTRYEENIKGGTSTLFIREDPRERSRIRESLGLSDREFSDVDCSDITNDQLGISGETGHGGVNLRVY